ncbi:WD40 repeat domain-containing serine/threonine-protein kinase [Okeania sp.]|uniref:WD40 repeat domain-containing serine/threonine-protein kinase n=1 Tax=Okeania sp. TaxID=3100323 RepID=UPI002B4B8890|nr:WD40 repeat domain-containing serine/threonine-protein kinase [Okeania sp.]MEB3341052.1 WD40 repeat domain-containing serine/threonine-protein kinase [Okeania sp.]
MSYCLNPNCQITQNPDFNKYCQNCGTKLLLKDRYRPLNLIGQGGFGRTFLAIDEDKPSKPNCVIKQFFPASQGTNNVNKAAELFEKEATRLDELGKHSQIPELMAHFTQDGRQYLIQEFIPGKNLAQALKIEAPYNEDQIRGFLKNLLPVLRFIHSHNVIHRDIKPENIIRCENSDHQLVLVDFGAAKYALGTALFKTGTTIGTPEYTAPEQNRGKAVFASDLYSLGVTCLHLLTKVSPFELFDVGEGTWVWRRYLRNNSVSEKLGYVLDKLIENAVNRRYQSVDAVMENLNTEPDLNLTLVQDKTAIQTPEVRFAPVPSQTWKCLHTLIGHQKWVCSVAFSPDSKIVASGSEDETIKLWEVNSGREILTLRGHLGYVNSVAFSPDGKILASGSDDKTIRFWDVQTGKLLCILGDWGRGEYFVHSGGVTAIAFHPNGKTLASASKDKTVKVWRLGDDIYAPNYEKLMMTLTGHTQPVRAIAFSPDGKILASGSEDNMIKIWDLSLGNTVKNLCNYYQGIHYIYAVIFSPDGKVLASGDRDNNIKIWQIESGEILQTLEGHSRDVLAVDFSPQGDIIVSGSEDGIIKIWDRKTGQQIGNLEGHLKYVNSVNFSKNGKILVSGSSDNTIKIWQQQ